MTKRQTQATNGTIAYYRIPDYSPETVDQVYDEVIEENHTQDRIFDMRGAGSLNSYALAKIRQAALKTPRSAHSLTAVVLDQHPSSRVTMIALQSLPKNLTENRLQIFYDLNDAQSWLQSREDF